MRLIVLAGLALTAAAQQPVEPTIRSDVRQVLVPVVVTDKQNHRVRGLKASDFAVLEDGAAQQITAFSGPEATGPQSRKINTGTGAPESAAPTTFAHTFVICLDTLHTSAESFERAREALEKLFHKQADTGARFVLLSLGRSLQMVQTGTTDTTLIDAKLRSKALTATMSGMDAQRLANEVNEIKETMETYCGGCPCGRDAQTTGACKAKQEQIRVDLDTRANRWAMFSSTFFTGLESVVGELGKLDGGRTIILVSDGFALKPGREFYAVASAYLPNSTQFAFDPVEAIQPSLDRAMRIAAEQNVVVDAIDSRGVSSPSFHGGLSDASSSQMSGSARSNRGGSVYHDMDSKFNSVAWENGSAMEQIAKATGGSYFHGNNDLGLGFREALAEAGDAYTIAYAPVNKAMDGKFRTISVKVNGLPYTVRAKSGYWADLKQ